MKLKRPLYGPGVYDGPSRGTDVLMVKRALGKTEDGRLPGPPYDGVYNKATVEGMRDFQASVNVRPTGRFGQATLDELEPYFDAYGKWKYTTFRVPSPDPPTPELVFPLAPGVGNICQGLHQTAGLLGNWAIDFCAPPSSTLVAPELCYVSRLSGHDPNDDTWDSMGVFGWTTYLRTPDGYEYFLTHQGRRVATTIGQKLEPGMIVGYIGDQEFRPDHAHLGVTSPLGEADAKKRITAVAAAPRVKPR